MASAVLCMNVLYSCAKVKSATVKSQYFQKFHSQSRVKTRHDSELVLCILGSLILARVTGQFIAPLKFFSNGNCPLYFVRMNDVYKIFCALLKFTKKFAPLS